MKALTTREQAIIGMVRYNDANPTNRIRKGVRLGRLTVEFEYRPRHKNVWGRFGGGWNWALGMMASRSTLILRLLVCSVIVRLAKADA